MSGRIPQSFIDDLIARTDIVDVIGSHVPLKKSGRDFSALCPFHDEKTPSFHVSPEKQVYHCFGCDAAGNVIGFLMDYDHMEFVEAIHDLASRAGMDVPQSSTPGSETAGPRNEYKLLLEKSAHFYQHQLSHHAASEHAQTYLRDRGLSTQTIQHFEIGFAPPGWNNLQKGLGHDKQIQNGLIETGMLIRKDNGTTYDRFRNRIMFPIRNTRGVIIGFGGRVIIKEEPKYLNSPETVLFEKGHELYGLYQLRKQGLPDHIIVVEGYMDVVSLYQHGIHNSVATLGTATTQHHLQSLFRLTDTVIFSFDGDRAGQEAAWRALQVCLPLLKEGRQVRFLILPTGEDPDSLIRSQGKASFIDQVQKAIPLSQFLFHTLTQKTDLSSIDGRSRLVEMARPLLNAVPSGVFRHMLLARLGEITKINVEKLSTLTGGTGNQSVETRSNATQKTQSTRPSIMRLAIRLLLERPDLSQKVGEYAWLHDLTVPGAKLLGQMIELTKANPHYTSGILIEHGHEFEQGAYLKTLHKWHPQIPETGIEAEFLDAIDRLYHMYLKQRRQQLLQKGRQAMSDEELLELQQLLKSIP